MSQFKQNRKYRCWQDKQKTAEKSVLFDDPEIRLVLVFNYSFDAVLGWLFIYRDAAMFVAICKVEAYLLL